jgi:hypothetical protein
MQNRKAFEQFAPSILKIYHRDKEAFWAAVLAPFMSDISFLSMWQHRKIGLDLLSAFRGLDDQAMQIQREFSAPMGIDVTKWKSNRPQYFKDAYPIFAFLAIWMDEVGLHDFLDNFDTVLRSAVFGVAGYGILDENVDSSAPLPVEVLTAQALISEYERLILQVFGVTPVNLQILHRMRSLFLEAEIKEKAARGKYSPYSLDEPEHCGTKGAHVVTPFMLSLERLGKAHLIDDYWRVFLLFGAVIQIIDDWTDLEKDLPVGHYSYVTLGHDNFRKVKDAKAAAKMLKSDRAHVLRTYQVSKDMIAESHAILNHLHDPFLARLVDITDMRLNAYFAKEFKITRVEGEVS